MRCGRSSFINPTTTYFVYCTLNQMLCSVQISSPDGSVLRNRTICVWWSHVHPENSASMSPNHLDARWSSSFFCTSAPFTLLSMVFCCCCCCLPSLLLRYAPLLHMYAVSSFFTRPFFSFFIFSYFLSGSCFFACFSAQLIFFSLFFLAMSGMAQVRTKNKTDKNHTCHRLYGLASWYIIFDSQRQIGFGSAVYDL